MLLDRLIGKGPLVLTLLIENLTFLNAIKRCKTAAKIRFPKRQDQVTDLMKRVDRVRERRNRFIHGDWIIEVKLLPSISIQTFKLRRDDTLDLWELEEDRTSVSKLKAQLKELVKLRREVWEFRNSIKPSDG